MSQVYYIKTNDCFSMCLGVIVNKEKIGNIMIFLAEKCGRLFHTNLLKLLYLIDEKATVELGSPLTWLEYKVWEKGPVSEDVYFSKNVGYNKFSDYIRFEETSEGYFLVIPIKTFNHREFSRKELDILESTYELYHTFNSKQLIDETHKEGGLWKNEINKHKIVFSEFNHTSDVCINFVDLIENDPFKKTIYYATLENLEFDSTLS